MKKYELKAALKAAARVAREREFFLIGSQAIHAHCKRPPAEVLLSQECDLYPRTHPQAAALLDRESGRDPAPPVHSTVQDNELALHPQGSACLNVSCAIS